MKKTSPTIQVKPDKITRNDLPPHQRAPKVTKMGATQPPSQLYKDNYDKIFRK
jgi:hypothetical protein